MKGRILGFDINKGEGIILDEHDNRYQFSLNQWREENSPHKGMDVDFEPVSTGFDDIMHAENIYTIKAYEGDKPQLADSINLLSFNDAIRQCFIKYIDFSGRASRKEYWYFTIFIMLVYFMIFALLPSSDEGISAYDIAYQLFSLVIVIPSLSVTVRRLHDIDFSGWWLLCYFFPIFGAVFLFILSILPSQKMTNRFGNMPY